MQLKIKMVLITFYFQLHQPYRPNPQFREDPKNQPFFWSSVNGQIYEKVARKCYIPATGMLTELVREHPDFKITVSTSGTLIEQAREYGTKETDLIAALQELHEAGKKHDQVEFLDETYYHSITSLFKDKGEWVDQILMHKKLMQKYFGVEPTSFRNTELFYNNEVAEMAQKLGYKAMLCEYRDDMDENKDLPKGHPQRRDRNLEVFKAYGTDMVVLARHRELSDDIAYRFGRKPVKAEDYVDILSKLAGKVLLWGVDYEHIGEHIWANPNSYDIFDFYRQLPKELAKHPNIVCANPTEISDKFEHVPCPEVNIPGLYTSSWADQLRNTDGWLGEGMQRKLFKEMEIFAPIAREQGGRLLEFFRHVTTSCHLHNIYVGDKKDKSVADAEVHQYFSAYESVEQAIRTLCSAIDFLTWAKIFPELMKTLELGINKRRNL